MSCSFQSRVQPQKLCCKPNTCETGCRCIKTQTFKFSRRCCTDNVPRVPTPASIGCDAGRLILFNILTGSGTLSKQGVLNIDLSQTVTITSDIPPGDYNLSCYDLSMIDHIDIIQSQVTVRFIVNFNTCRLKVSPTSPNQIADLVENEDAQLLITYKPNTCDGILTPIFIVS